jgi:ribosomal protein S18 acetylase RimI-like enzyme
VQKNIYPTEETALDALEKGDIFVLEKNGCILAAARINQRQEEEYANCQWAFAASDSEVMVLHTLVVDPDASGRGIGSQFVRFYEEFAITNGCHYLRMDTNVINTVARALYKKHGYSERGIVRCKFNGINDVQLVCLEKKLT